VTSVAVLDGTGTVVAAAPGLARAEAGEAAAALWAAAARSAGEAGLEHLVVPVPGGAVAALEAQGHLIVAVTGPRPAIALLLFDLRTCLDDAYAMLEGGS
jgi:hypothetical protein